MSISDEDFGLLELAVRALVDRYEKKQRDMNRYVKNGTRPAEEGERGNKHSQEQLERLYRARDWMREQKRRSQ